MSNKIAHRRSKADTKVTMKFYQDTIAVFKIIKLWIIGSTTVKIRSTLLKSTQDYKMTKSIMF
jgi:hypothetical protein